MESGFRKPNSIHTELLYNPAGIGCRENCMLKEAYSMNTRFSSGNIENLKAEKEIQKKAVSYEHAGYQVRVHFNGDKTLSQCIQNLAERKIAG